MTSGSGTGLLIVNADDFGRDSEATDLTLECFRAGRITSTSAMVFMEDSDRASELVRQTALPVGVHINLSEAFTDPTTPQVVRDRQARMIRRFGPDRGRQLLRWIYDPRIQADVEQCIADQLARFSEVYGRPPTHVDGHQHVHVCPNVLIARSLATGTWMRSALDTNPVHHSRGRLTRRLRQRMIDRRFRRTDHFFDIADVDPRLPSNRASPLLALADTSTVEVMVHPAFAHERDRLMSPEWGQALRAHRTGSFADLGPTRRA